jgi:hypothetical protein
MEIGAVVLLLAIGIGGWFSEKTKIGGKITHHMAKFFFGVDLNDLED